MEPGRYFSTMNNTKDKQRVRFQMVQYAKETSISEAARYFRATRKTLRKWTRRYEQEGYCGLSDRSRAPHHCPHKSSPSVEKRVLELRDLVPWGPERIRQQWGERALPCGVGSFKRIIREHGKQRPARKKKSQRKNDLRAAKAGILPCRNSNGYQVLKRLGCVLSSNAQMEPPRFQCDS